MPVLYFVFGEFNVAKPTAVDKGQKWSPFYQLILSSKAESTTYSTPSTYVQ